MALDPPLAANPLVRLLAAPASVEILHTTAKGWQVVDGGYPLNRGRSIAFRGGDWIRIDDYPIHALAVGSGLLQQIFLTNRASMSAFSMDGYDVSSCHLFGIFLNESPIGFFTVGYRERPRSFALHWLELFSPQHQGAGIGAALICDHVAQARRHRRSLELLAVTNLAHIFPLLLKEGYGKAQAHLIDLKSREKSTANIEDLDWRRLSIASPSEWPFLDKIVIE